MKDSERLIQSENIWLEVLDEKQLKKHFFEKVCLYFL
jgi:hypothetical protein